MNVNVNVPSFTNLHQLLCFLRINVRGPFLWIELSSVLRPRQHSIGYMGDGFYRSKDPTNSIKSKY